MNSLERHLILSAPSEKVAFDQSIRNFGSDVVGYGGKVLRRFDKNPLISSAVVGAGLGATEGALTAERHGESKTRRGLRHALYGAVGGAATGGLFSGATSNIGRYGKDIDEKYKKLRGASGLRDLKRGEFAELMRDTVFNSDSLRGGKELKALRDAHDRLEAIASTSGTPEAAKRVIEARRKLNKAGGGFGTRFNPLQAAGIIGAGAGAGIVTANVREKNASARLGVVIDELNKEANFGALAAKALGYGAQGAGKAIQMGAANPALAGAAVGAAGGAIAGGEGNRLKGALGGAALGAGAGAGLAKLAPQATANMGQFGSRMKSMGKSIQAKAGREGATFASATEGVAGKYLGGVRGNFARQNITQSIADQGKTLIGNGMSGRAAAGTALAGVGAAGLAGGAATSAMFGSDPKTV